MPVDETARAAMPSGLVGAKMPQTFREKLGERAESLRRELDHAEKFIAHYDSLNDDQKATFEGLLGRIYLH